MSNKKTLYRVDDFIKVSKNLLPANSKGRTIKKGIIELGYNHPKHGQFYQIRFIDNSVFDITTDGSSWNSIHEVVEHLIARKIT